MTTLFNIAGGLALFIYGMTMLGDGLQKCAGDRFRAIIDKLTTNPMMGVLVGAGITSIIQSSSATSVLAIGFVNSGLMTFNQALGIILGANVGTTITAQLVAFKLTKYALPILTVGFVLYFVCKKQTWKYLGYCLLGCGILFLGLSIMTSILKPLAADPVFRNFFIQYSNNMWLAFLVGIVTTAIIQSSSATTGIVIALALSDLITLQGALPIILGCNIGTCVTALIASIGTNINGKRTALAHLLFNLFGSLIFLSFVGPFQNLIVLTASDLARQCANAHVLFNLTTTLILLPFIKQFAKLIIKLIPGELKKLNYKDTKYLESHLLNTPSVAIEAAVKEIVRTLKLTDKMVNLSLDGLLYRNLTFLESIDDREKTVDNKRLHITEYLIEIGAKSLTLEESRKIPSMVHVINDVERIGDHAVNIKKLAEQIVNKNLKFSTEAIEELKNMKQNINIMLNDTSKALCSNDIETAKIVLEKEKIINKLRDTLKTNHIRRLNKCNILSGVAFIDTINNLEKIGDHLTNIGQAVMDGLQWS